MITRCNLRNLILLRMITFLAVGCGPSKGTQSETNLRSSYISHGGLELAGGDTWEKSVVAGIMISPTTGTEVLRSGLMVRTERGTFQLVSFDDQEKLAKFLSGIEKLYPGAKAYIANVSDERKIAEVRLYYQADGQSRPYTFPNSNEDISKYFIGNTSMDLVVDPEGFVYEQTYITLQYGTGIAKRALSCGGNAIRFQIDRNTGRGILYYEVGQDKIEVQFDHGEFVNAHDPSLPALTRMEAPRKPRFFAMKADARWKFLGSQTDLSFKMLFSGRR